MLIPNHGLGYLATALKNAGHEPVIIDCIRDRKNPHDFAKYVKESGAGLVGFQIYTFDLPVLRPYINALCDLDIPIITGGPHPSADPVDTLNRFTEIQFVFRGEAERGLLKLADLMDSGESLTPDLLALIPGLCYRTETGVICNPVIFEPDLDALGFPDWDQIGPDSYPVAPQGTFTRQLPLAPIIVTRGCPYPCTFCAGKQVSGRKIRHRSVDHVISELRYLVQRFGIREFHIQDDNFTFSKEYVTSFCQSLIDSELNLCWACPNGVRLDTLDKEMLRMMETAGCYSVAVGIEAGTQRVLDLMKKQTSLGDLIYKVNLIRSETSWFITGFFILGYPGETEEEIWQTIRLSKRLPLDKANFGILMPLPGTEAAEAARREGFNPETDLLRMSEYRSPYTPSTISQRKFRWIFRWAFIGFYARPRIIWRFVRQIQSLSQMKILVHRFLDVVKP